MIWPWSHRKALALLNFSTVALFVLCCISVSFWYLYPRQRCKLAPFSFRPSSYYSFSAPVYFVVMQNRIKWAPTDLLILTAFKATLKICMSFLRATVWGLFDATKVQWGGEGFRVAGEVWYRVVESVAWSLAAPIWPFLIVSMLSLVSSLGRRGTWVRLFWGTGMCSIGMR